MTWTEQDIRGVWEKGEVVGNLNAAKWRKDACGAWMSRDQHGNHNSNFGWEIDHILPVAEGGGNALSNLRPLQWKNAGADRKGGALICLVTAYGGENIDR